MIALARNLPPLVLVTVALLCYATAALIYVRALAR